VSTRHLYFDLSIGRQKPENIINRSADCPFCERHQLEEIIAQEGSIWLVKNKYHVLQDAYQTVLIETDVCDAELSVYPKEHLYQVIRFGVHHWLEMAQSKEFSSAIFFKNHGPFSGGTIRHPHMQIIGLNDIEYLENLQDEIFEGMLIAETEGVLFNISTKPKIGFIEFNIIGSLDQLTQLADYIQTAAHFTLHHFHRHCNSYNLFFYQWRGQIAVKVVPRFVVSPLYVGFSIPQVPTRLDGIIRSIQDKYFNPS
jgi:ATP adenylyltransferase/5',5'''-P-1,P-4-tetraphosphate phosphorylase II